MSEFIKGSFVALVTPMFEDGSLDFETYKRLIDFHIKSGTDAIVAIGTTGESPTVSFEEHLSLIEVAVQHSAGRIPIIAGSGANSTSEAIDLTKQAENIGVNASLQVVPYYNKPSQEGLYQHFKIIAEATSLPIILYNVPGRTVADLSNATVVKLSTIKNIVGIKDATGDLVRGQALLRDLPSNFAVYSGDDPSAVSLILLGGAGNISVTANVLPRTMSKMCKSALKGHAIDVAQLNIDLLEIHKTLFIESNPIPIKWLMYEMGLIPCGIRLPLTSPSLSTKTKLKELIENINYFEGI
ncbi:MAG: 4-hydroxy-tetrahydrodipicolinate synthase [Betaproteobacteria bacterium TMED156]|nr:MAG: 4-hydroxy-tetrahydrodipicolinate synthase [Betaproteobacteria bacterium TMED156]|tara:strand:- start:79 stop:972 length:894 start_codon:yes stop_codon:yes gene_type:complete